MRSTRLLILGLVLLVAAMEAAEQDLHFKLSIINASPKTVDTKHGKDEENNDYIELSHEQTGKSKHNQPPFLQLSIDWDYRVTPSKCFTPRVNIEIRSLFEYFYSELCLNTCP